MPHFDDGMPEAERLIREAQKVTISRGLFEEVQDFIEGLADAYYVEGIAQPNKAMSLLSRLHEESEE